MNLHNKIMNIQTVVSCETKAIDSCMSTPCTPLERILKAYKLGHRDARHDAAELSIQTDEVE